MFVATPLSDCITSVLCGCGLGLTHGVVQLSDAAEMVLLSAGSNQDAVWADPDDRRTFSWVRVGQCTSSFICHTYIIHHI